MRSFIHPSLLLTNFAVLGPDGTYSQLTSSNTAQHLTDDDNMSVSSSSETVLPEISAKSHLSESEMRSFETNERSMASSELSCYSTADTYNSGVVIESTTVDEEPSEPMKEDSEVTITIRHSREAEKSKSASVVAEVTPEEPDTTDAGPPRKVPRRWDVAPQ